MAERLSRSDEDEAFEAPARQMPVPGRMAATARLFPGALFRKARDANGVAPGAEDSVARASSSSGSALPSEIRTKFESSLGADLSGVRVHTGASSADAASAVGARAYTIGNDIHFADGEYTPSDPFGLHLLAHEVAHTQQQSGGPPQRQHKLEVSTAGDVAEQDADRAADAMVAGQPVTVSRVGTNLLRKAASCETTPDDPKAAPDDKQMSARDAIAAAEDAAIDAMNRVVDWVYGQYAAFAKRSVMSSKVANNNANLSVAITRAAFIEGARVVGASFSAELGPAGAILKLVLPLAAEKLANAIAGEAPLDANQAYKLGRDQAVAKMMESYKSVAVPMRDDALAKIHAEYGKKKDTIKTRYNDSQCVDEVSKWATDDKAASEGVHPSGDDLLHALLMNWVTDHTDAYFGNDPGVDSQDWADNVNELDVDVQASMWAFELRRDFQRLGLPTDTVDVWIARKFPTFHGGPNGHPPRGAKESCTATFHSTNKPDALATALQQANNLPDGAPVLVHIRLGNDFNGRVDVALEINYPDGNAGSGVPRWLATSIQYAFEIPDDEGSGMTLALNGQVDSAEYNTGHRNGV